MAENEQVNDWQEALDLAGELVRPDGNDGDSAEQQAIARSYTVNRARRRLNLHKNTVTTAIQNGIFSAFVDPDDNQRIPADEVEKALNDAQIYEEVALHERISPREIADAMDVKTSTARKRLRQKGIDFKKMACDTGGIYPRHYANFER